MGAHYVVCVREEDPDGISINHGAAPCVCFACLQVLAATQDVMVALTAKNEEIRYAWMAWGGGRGGRSAVPHDPCAHTPAGPPRCTVVRASQDSERRRAYARAPGAPFDKHCQSFPQSPTPPHPTPPRVLRMMLDAAKLDAATKEREKVRVWRAQCMTLHVLSQLTRTPALPAVPQ